MAKMICPKCGHETVKRFGRVECPMNMPYQGCGWWERPSEIRNKRVPKKETNERQSS